MAITYNKQRLILQEKYFWKFYDVMKLDMDYFVQNPILERERVFQIIKSLLIFATSYSYLATV